MGPETVSLGEAVRRIGAASGRRPRLVRLPVPAHLLLGWLAEQVMTVPLVSTAQVRILAEGATQPAPAAAELPDDLRPATPFSMASIRAGLPEPGGFRRSDLRPRAIR